MEHPVKRSKPPLKTYNWLMRLAAILRFAYLLGVLMRFIFRNCIFLQKMTFQLYHQPTLYCLRSYLMIPKPSMHQHPSDAQRIMNELDLVQFCSATSSKLFLCSSVASLYTRVQALVVFSTHLIIHLKNMFFVSSISQRIK